GKAERRAVAIGETRGKETLVTSGILAGEHIVVDGPPELSGGDPVREIDR
ncbi:MAG: efflux transporter periplasmic adaptor subunit, partial [Gammaproteobacteria bacterium]|nr:efflux transporter periplasmic adaptor subunit [Gammaproteobacteria bacterium]